MTILLALALGGVSFAEDAEPRKGATPEASATTAEIATPQSDVPGESRSVTLDEAVTLALANNIQLASDAIDLRIKKRSSEYAWTFSSHRQW